MAKIKLKSASLSSDPEVKAPRFYFMPYSKGMTVTNNEEEIDFVTDGKSLYVAFQNGQVQLNGDEIGANSQYLLKIVSQGEKGEKGNPGIDGAAGVVPEIGAEYIDIGDEKKLALTVGGKRKAMTGDLTPPVYVPTLVNDRYLTWEWNGDEPATIDLMKLRPVNERPILLRTNSDNTKLDAEVSGPANFIQWKYEGDEHWTNLISIQELMNLAFAGMCTWEAADGKWHFGYKEVVKATYDSTKSGRRIINRVELGQILFDAGEIPLQDYGIEIEMIEAQLEELKNSVQSISIDGGRKLTPDKDGNVDLDLSDYAKKSDVPDTVDAYTKAESDAKYQPKGNYLTQHQSLKTINDQSLIGTGNITISAGNTSLFDIKIENGHLYKTSDGQNWTDLGAIGESSSGEGCPECWTREQIQDLIDTSLEGLNLPDKWVTFADLDRFITISDLADYATKNYVESRIQDAITDQSDLDYYRIFTLYQRTNSRTTAPNAPVQGNFVWDTSKGEIVLQPTFTSNWKNHPQNATTATPYLWQATATYSYKSKAEVKGDDETEYWHVVCLTGERGDDGADGNGVEFIYTLVDSLAEFNALTTPIAPGTGPDSYPDPWQDHPEGVSEEHPIEAASVRKYNGVTEQWEAYCEPFIWSKWGEDGVDGDGVEYIFHVDASDTLSNNLIPAQTLEDIYYTTNGQIDYSRPKPGYENYDTSDWVPDGQNGRPDQNWSDNPSDVDEQQPYEWVSIRKYNGQTGHWGPFSVPKIWGLWGQKTVIQQEVVSGTTVYKSYNCYAFTRTNLDISGYRVTGGQAYDNPLNGIVTKNGDTTVQMTWSDGIPNGTEQLWSIQALIGDESQSSDAAWSSPARVGDRPGFQVEFAASNTNTDAVYNKTKTLPSLNNYLADTPEGVDEVAWRNAVSTANCGSWSDTSDENTVYMAESRIVAGSWTPWNVIKIKGETGEQGPAGPQGRNGSNGADGKDIEFVYYRTANENQRPGMSATEGSYDGTTASSEDPYLDNFLPKTTANGFTLQDGTYWHDHPSGVNENLTCEWVGIRHSSYQNGNKIWNAFNIALWSKYGANGRDGDGIEYVFFALTPEQHEFVQAGMTYNNVEYSGKLPVDNSVISGVHGNPAEQEFWPNSAPILNNSDVVRAQDDNPGMTEQKPYVYCSQRKYSGLSSSWGPFGPASLWLAGSEATYTYADVNFNEDSIPVLVNASNMQPVEKSTGTAMNSVAFYVGTRKLTYKKVEVKINDVWTNFQTISETSGGTSSYNIVTTPLTIYSYNDKTVVLDDFGSYITDSGLQALNVKLTFTEGYVFNEPIEIPVRVTSFETYADNSYYSAEGVLKFIPITTNFTLEVRAKGIIKKSNVDSTDYTNTSNIISIFRTSLDKNQIGVQFNGTESFPTDYTNWTVKVFFDGVQTYSIPFGTIYKSWRDNYHNDLDDGISLEKYYDPSGTVVNGYSGLPVSLNIHKTFVKDQHSDHHYQSDYIGLQLDMNSLPLLVDNIKFALYDNSTLVDEEIIPIFYNGKNGNSTEHLGYITSDYELDNTEWPQNDTSAPDDEPASDEEDDGSNGPSKAPTRGGETQQQGPEIEIDENGQVHITPGDDGNVKIDDGSGNYDVVDINAGTIYRYELIKVTTYDANNNPSVKIVANKVETIEAPSYYLIKDVHYYDDVNGDPLTVNKKIYALMVDNGQLVIREVADNNSNQSEEETEP